MTESGKLGNKGPDLGETVTIVGRLPLLCSLSSWECRSDRIWDVLMKWNKVCFLVFCFSSKRLDCVAAYRMIILTYLVNKWISNNGICKAAPGFLRVCLIYWVWTVAKTKTSLKTTFSIFLGLDTSNGKMRRGNKARRTNYVCPQYTFFEEIVLH